MLFKDPFSSPSPLFLLIPPKHSAHSKEKGEKKRRRIPLCELALMSVLREPSEREEGENRRERTSESPLSARHILHRPLLVYG